MHFWVHNEVHTKLSAYYALSVHNNDQTIARRNKNQKLWTESKHFALMPSFFAIYCDFVDVVAVVVVGDTRIAFALSLNVFRRVHTLVLGALASVDTTHVCKLFNSRDRYVYIWELL